LFIYNYNSLLIVRIAKLPIADYKQTLKWNYITIIYFVDWLWTVCCWKYWFICNCLHYLLSSL